MRIFHHRVETTLPLQSHHGTVEIFGWCVAEGLTRAPHVKLVSPRGEIGLVQRSARRDVTASFDLAIEGDLCGFQLRGTLPPGVHLLTLLAAEADNQAWHVLQRLTVIVLSRGLQVSIECPSAPIIRESVRIQGWCVHPEESLREVWLHYGTRRVPCEFGLPRLDVPAFAPAAPDARNSGFITSKNAPAGRGALRVVAIDAKGTRHVARPEQFLAINSDEENPRGLNLPEQLARVSPARRITAAPTGEGIALDHHARVLFVLYGDLTANSAIHVTALANAMIELGHECVVAVPEHPETLSNHRGARFRAVAFAAVPRDGSLFTHGRPPDIIHAWTTRENVRRFCEPLRAATQAKLVVHLEDNEQRILEMNLGRPIEELQQLSLGELDEIVPATLSHPRRGLDFLRSADGISIIIEKIRELVPAGVPVHTFWPAADPNTFFPRPIPAELRAALGLGPEHSVLFYHGNVHAANLAEMRELYAAVTKLNAEGYPTTLLRCGRDFTDLGSDGRHVISLGRIGNHHVGSLMALADFFVQPGEADAFNEYRFPSKLAEFFALGRPVILPFTNLGRMVRHGEDAYVVEKADAPGIAGAIKALRADPALYARLSAGAVAFAESHFNWPKTAKNLLQFYGQLRVVNR